MPGTAFGLYTHQRNNRIRSGFLLAGLFLLVYLTVWGLLLVEGGPPEERGGGTPPPRHHTGARHQAARGAMVEDERHLHATNCG